MKHFRPRYSLLTLLLLTALVAGGVKIWRGPHHVIEWNSDNTIEDEYTYTRIWRGDKLLQGPRVLRYYHHDDKVLFCVKIKYYLQGIRTEHEQEILVYGAQTPTWSGMEIYRQKPLELPPADKRIFAATIAEEAAKVQALGLQAELVKYDELE